MLEVTNTQVPITRHGDRSSAPEEHVGSKRGSGVVLQWRGRADPEGGNLETGTGPSQRARLVGSSPTRRERQEPLFLPPSRWVPEGSERGVTFQEGLLAFTLSQRPHQAAFLPPVLQMRKLSPREVE